MAKADEADRSFPKERRLLKRKDFRLVYDTGTPYRNAGFHLFVRRRDDGEAPTRLGLTTPRASGKSTVRNLLRRRAREFFRLHRDHVAEGYDLVANLHGSLARRDRRDFDRLFADVLRKAEIMDGPERRRD